MVVEDLIYIDDLEILIYTTIAPKTSSAFVISVKKVPTAIDKRSQIRIEQLLLN